MIRYRFIILSPGLKPLRTFKNSKAISDFLRERDQHSYVEVQAYDDMEPDHPRAWTEATISSSRWFEQRHDMLYELIEAYGTKLDEIAETELRAKIHAPMRSVSTSWLPNLPALSRWRAFPPSARLPHLAEDNRQAFSQDRFHPLETTQPATVSAE